MNDIGIEKVAHYLPEKRLSNTDRMAEFEVDREWLEKKLGVLRVARKAPEEEASDLAVKAASKLVEGGLDPASVDCLVLVTQNPDGYGLPHASSAVHAKLGLEKTCACFDISLGCSGYVYGLSVVKAFMQANGLERGLLITADPYSIVVRPDDRDTVMIFGDGAAATLMSEAPVWTVGMCDFVSDGSVRQALEVDQQHNLHMNGRQVFNFCATSVPGSIKRMLEKNGVALNAVDRFLLHQGSRYIVDTIGKRLGEPGKCGFFAADYGNTVSSSLPILLADNIENTDKTLVLAGFGVGLSCASTVLRRV